MNDVCNWYTVLKRLCVKIDVFEDGSKERVPIKYSTGCYEDGDVGYYEPWPANETYNFSYVPIEVRSNFDPYTVWAEAEYNMGRDLTIMFWLSIIFVSLAFLLTVFLTFAISCFVKKPSRDSMGPYRQ